MVLIILLYSMLANAGEITQSYNTLNNPATEHLKKMSEYETDLSNLSYNSSKAKSDKKTQEKFDAQEKVIKGKIFEESVAAITSFIAQPKETTAEDLFANTLQNLSVVCSASKESLNCDNILALGSQSIEKKWGNAKSFYSAQAQREVGNYFFEKNNLPQAMWSFRAAYDQMSKKNCDNFHAFILVHLLNTSRKMKDEKSYDKYWKIAKYCEDKGLMEKKGSRFDIKKPTEEVVFYQPPINWDDYPQAVSKSSLPKITEVKPANRNEFIIKVSDLTLKMNSIEDELVNKMAEALSQDKNQDVRKLGEDNKAKHEKMKQLASNEYQQLIAKDPRILKKQLKNLTNLPQSSVIRKHVKDIFGEADAVNNVQNTMAYALYIGGKMVYIAVEGGYRPLQALIYFKFAPDNSLQEISFSTASEKYIIN